MEDLVITPTFWLGRRVLVTGHTGFKGSWLALWLQTMGARVVGFALPPATRPNLFEATALAGQMVSILADIRDRDALVAAVASHRPEVVFHLAAQALVLPSYASPAETYACNVMGTVNLLDAIRQCGGVRSVVIVSSDKCYQPRATACNESDPLGGSDPYSSSKACSELVAAAYRSSFFSPINHREHGVALATARAGNAIGGGDWSAGRLIPDAVRAFADRRPLLVRHPEAIRPWQHVLEPLSGYLILGQRLYEHGSRFAEAWNFGPAGEPAYSVAELLTTMAGIWGEGAAWQRDDAAHPHEAPCLQLAVTKAVEGLHWHPRWPLASALQMTVDWYRAHLEGSDMAAVSRQQIRRYCETARNLVCA